MQFIECGLQGVNIKLNNYGSLAVFIVCWKRKKPHYKYSWQSAAAWKTFRTKVGGAHTVKVSVSQQWSQQCISRG